MAYTPCENNVPSMNALKDCFKPSYGGMLVAGIGFPLNALSDYVIGDTNATKNQVSNIALSDTSAVFAVEASGETPWESTQEEYDSATSTFNKTVHFIAPAHGAGFTGEFVEPILKNKDGYVFVLQRRDKNGDCAFPIIGLEKGAVGSTGTMDYNSSDTGGCYELELVESNAPSGELDLVADDGSTDYASVKAAFDALADLVMDNPSRSTTISSISSSDTASVS